VPERWFLGAKVKAAGLPGRHRVDWLYGGAGLSLEGDGLDLQGKRVHINRIGPQGWVDRNGKKTGVGSKMFFRNVGWRAKGGKVTFPLDPSGWYHGLKPKRYIEPKGIDFAPGPSLPLTYWQSIATDPRVIPRGSRVYVPKYRNKPGGGWMRAVDTGSAIKGRHIDVYRAPPPEDGGAASYEDQRIYVIPPKKPATASADPATPPATTTPIPPNVPGDPIDVASAKLAQHAFKLQLQLRLGEALRAGDLRAKGRSLCLAYSGAAPTAQLCIEHGRLVLIPAKGKTKTFRSQIEIGSKDVKVTFAYAVEGIKAGRLRWRIQSSDPACAAPRTGCQLALPASGTNTLKVVQPRPSGCQRRGKAEVFSGSTAGKRIAITFDDGPGPYTPQVLAVLKRFGVTATFFELGQQVKGFPGYSRAVLAAGHLLANHSYNHPMLPPAWQLRDTSAIIKRTTGFKPCLFRPPYGAVNGRLVNDALQNEMTTVVWSVDPRDWSTPGVGAIENRILGPTRAGSIILMHDAGGPRGQTVAALPTILGTLKKRGYKFVTVADLLGYKVTYSPS
jgi:peptidoglycan/xylan/chitin deacetylase (PgdA/CDA1 family)/3D (Asp-Asp-Asp) domain-containing protein